MSDGKKKNLTESQKWIVSLVCALIFLVVGAPIVYRLTGGLFKLLGITIQQGGCPNYLGLLIHAVVFAVLIRLVMEVNIPGLPKENYCLQGQHHSFTGYQGLADPGDMMKCNAAYLQAEDTGCDTCMKAAITCMAQPYTKVCSTALKECKEKGKDEKVSNAVVSSCSIGGHVDYFPMGVC